MHRPEMILDGFNFEAGNLPELLGSGSKSLVFRHPDHSDLVLKIDRYALGDLAYNTQASDRLFPGPHNPGDEHGYWAAQLIATERNWRHMQLRDAFGQEHVPPAVTRVGEIPLTADVSRQLWDDSPIEGSGTRWFLTFIVDQPFIAEALSPETHGVQGMKINHLEADRTLDPALYIEANRRWVELQAGEDWELFVATHGNASFATFAELLGDQSFREVARDFVTRAFAFSRETGEPLDIGGDNNIIFYKDGAAWQYTLVDALHYPNAPMLRMAEAFFDQLPKKLESFGNHQEWVYLFNSLDYVRTINALAGFLGLKHRIDLMRGREFSDSIWLRMLDKMRRATDEGNVRIRKFPTRLR